MDDDSSVARYIHDLCIHPPAPVRRALEGYLEKRGTWPDTHVVLNAQKTGVSVDAIHDVYAHLHPHALRHTAAKELMKANNDWAVVGAILGHTKADTTLRYLTPTPEEMAAAMERLEEE